MLTNITGRWHIKPRETHCRVFQFSKQKELSCCTKAFFGRVLQRE
jgi:hypothetical protein